MHNKYWPIFQLKYLLVFNRSCQMSINKLFLCNQWFLIPRNTSSITVPISVFCFPIQRPIPTCFVLTSPTFTYIQFHHWLYWIKLDQRVVYWNPLILISWSRSFPPSLLFFAFTTRTYSQVPEYLQRLHCYAPPCRYYCFDITHWKGISVKKYGTPSLGLLAFLSKRSRRAVTLSIFPKIYIR